MTSITIKITETKPPEVCTEYHIDADNGTELEKKVAGFVKHEIDSMFDRMRDIMSDEGSVQDVHGPDHIVSPAIENMKRSNTGDNPRFKIE